MNRNLETVCLPIRFSNSHLEPMSELSVDDSNCSTTTTPFIATMKMKDKKADSFHADFMSV